MGKRMLIDASHPEETRVVVLSGNRLEEFDYESAARTQLKGNIYLAKVTRIEPSLQAAFVDYGGNRHGFLAFNEIHPDYYQIPVSDREALIQAEQEAERAAAARENNGDLDDDIEPEADESAEQSAEASNGEADDAPEEASTLESTSPLDLGEDDAGGQEQQAGSAPHGVTCARPRDRADIRSSSDAEVAFSTTSRKRCAFMKPTTR